MLPFLLVSAFAATLEVVGDTSTLSVRDADGTGPAPTLRQVEGGALIEDPGGWVTLWWEGRPTTVFLEPEQRATLQVDVGLHFDAAALQQLADVAAWVADLRSPTAERARRHAARLRKLLAASPVSPADDDRALAMGLALLAQAAVQRADREVLLIDDAWYFRLRDALDLPASVQALPAWRMFGWEYGRYGAGVVRFGLPRAFERMVANTDEVARDAVLRGVLDWALESASTDAHLAAVHHALDRWSDVGGTAPTIDRYRSVLVQRERTRIGAEAPAWADVVDVAGGAVSLQELRGRPVVLDFWGTWCGPCVASIPEMQAMAYAWAGRVTFVALAKEAPGGQARWLSTLKQHGWGEPTVQLYTETDAAERALSIFKYPTYLVLDADGRVVGVVDDAAALPPLLERALPPP